MGTITLLTDFGTTDPFVGIMKGVILQVNPQARIVDISHDIAPQDVLQAAHEIAYSYRYFPEGTVHLVVVDPGVGSDRSVLALRVDTQTLLAPAWVVFASSPHQSPQKSGPTANPISGANRSPTRSGTAS